MISTEVTWVARAWVVGFFAKMGAVVGWTIMWFVIEVRIDNAGGGGLVSLMAPFAPDALLGAVGGAVAGALLGLAIGEKLDGPPPVTTRKRASASPWTMTVPELRRAIVNEQVPIFESEFAMLMRGENVVAKGGAYDDRVVKRLRQRLNDKRKEVVAWQAADQRKAERRALSKLVVEEDTP